MRAFTYFLSEAAASLWRGRRAAIFSVITIAGGLFVLGFFLVLNANLQRVVGRWTESAELSVCERRCDRRPDADSGRAHRGKRPCGATGVCLQEPGDGPLQAGLPGSERGH